MGEAINHFEWPAKPDKDEKISLLKPRRLSMITAVGVIQLIMAYFLLGTLFHSDNVPARNLPSSFQPAIHRNLVAASDRVYLVKNLSVNPAGTDGKKSLEATIGLAVTSHETMSEIEHRDIQLRDSIIEILASRTIQELDGKNSCDQLKSEIKRRINGELLTGTVVEVYFSEFVIH